MRESEGPIGYRPPDLLDHVQAAGSRLLDRTRFTWGGSVDLNTGRMFWRVYEEGGDARPLVTVIAELSGEGYVATVAYPDEDLDPVGTPPARRTTGRLSYPGLERRRIGPSRADPALAQRIVEMARGEALAVARGQVRPLPPGVASRAVPDDAPLRTALEAHGGDAVAALLRVVETMGLRDALGEALQECPSPAIR